MGCCETIDARYEESKIMGIASFGLGRWFYRDTLPDAKLASPLGYQLPRGDRGLILVVDDSEAIQAFLAKMLRQAGYMTMSACDGLVVRQQSIDG
jgi:hypothetical protein